MKRTLGWLALISALSLGGYLLMARLNGFSGFPLDDAWIHQTYARNLGLRGEWAFIPGKPSAGSTAPLWSLLLAAGYPLRLAPYIWTYLLGWVMLFSTALVGVYTFQKLCPQRASSALWVGIYLALEWHLVWAAGSGMETLLMACLALVILGSLLSSKVHSLRLGLLIGLCMWVRPDGITLAGPAVLTIVLIEPTWKQRFTSLARLGLGIVLLAAPYLFFNRLLAGNWWPNTFFAKQAEYAIYRETPIVQRYLRLAVLPLVGPGVLLLPGFFLFLTWAVRHKSWGALAGAAWMLGYIGLYSLRLPVTYQYGRYIMPAMPVYDVWSLAGMAIFLQTRSPVLWRRVVSTAWLAALALVLLVFWGIGARAYARDVAIIDTEMVAAARWISENTPPGALIAAHDIGALGYFGERPILDLAGLVSPEVIPFIRDESHLADYLDAQDAQYLVTFPGWYPNLVTRGQLIFTTGGIFAPLAGQENMAIYRWRGP
jgi:hypothetical protein